MNYFIPTFSTEPDIQQVLFNGNYSSYCSLRGSLKTCSISVRGQESLGPCASSGNKEQRPRVSVFGRVKCRAQCSVFKEHGEVVISNLLTRKIIGTHGDGRLVKGAERMLNSIF